MRIDTAQLNVINKAKAWKRSKGQDEFARRSHELHLAVHALETLEGMHKKPGLAKAKGRAKKVTRRKGPNPFDIENLCDADD